MPLSEIRLTFSSKRTKANSQKSTIQNEIMWAFKGKNGQSITCSIAYCVTIWDAACFFCWTEYNDEYKLGVTLIIEFIHNVSREEIRCSDHTG